MVKRGLYSVYEALDLVCLEDVQCALADASQLRKDS